MLGREADRLVEVAFELRERLLRARRRSGRARARRSRPRGRRRAWRAPRAARCARPRRRSVASSKDWTPSESRETPAARKPGRRSRSSVLGFTSSVISTGARRGERARARASTTRATRFRPQQRRRAAAEVEAREPPAGEGGARAPQLARAAPPRSAARAPRERPRRHHREVAVGADALAERHVHVDADARVAHAARSRRRRAPVRPARRSDTLGRVVSLPDVHREHLPERARACCCARPARAGRRAPDLGRVGSADERPGEDGLAHFHEHMLFKGTERRGVGEVAGDVEGAGGRINAYTSFDVTVYHATLPSDGSTLGIDVLADAVLHSVFDPSEISREIEVVLEEIRRGEDSPCQRARQRRLRRGLPRASLPRADPGHARERRGLRPRARARLLRALVRARQAHGGGGRRLRSRAAAGAAARGLRRGGAERRARERARRAAAARAAQRRAGAPLRAREPRARLARRRARRTRTRALLDLLAFVLGSGESSPPGAARASERDELVERVDASCYTPLDPGSSRSASRPTARAPRDAIDAAVREVERLRARAGLGARSSRRRAPTSWPPSTSSARASRGSRQSSAASSCWPATTARRRATSRACARATPDDLLRVAREHLAPERLTVGGRAAGGRRRRARRRAASRRRSARGRRGGSSALRGAARGAARRAPRSSPTRSHSGARLYVLPRRDAAGGGGARRASAAASSPRTPAAPASPPSSPRMWLRGTEQRSAAEFARAVEGLAAEIDGFAGRSSLGLTLECRARSFEPALDLFAEVLLAPAFAEDELERERRETLAAIERREDRLAQRALLLFAETHYRQPSLPPADARQRARASRASTPRGAARAPRAPGARAATW